MKTKTLFLLILLPLLCYNNVQAQEDVFPRDSAIWVIEVVGSKPHNIVICGILGDTLINNQKYQKLYLLNDTTLNIDDRDIYIAGIRQKNKKVWIQPAETKGEDIFEEYLLYDFSKSEGEDILYENGFELSTRITNYISNFTFRKSFEENDFYEGAFSRKIEKEETTEYGRLLKLSYFEDGDYLWIEGVGSLSGLFLPPVRYNSYGGEGFVLNCMKLKDKVKYLNEFCSSCFSGFENSDIEKNIQTATKVVYHHLEKTLECTNNKNNIPVTFRLMNIRGDVLLTETIFDEYQIINLNLISNGIYIYTITGRKKEQIGKIVIQ